MKKIQHRVFFSVLAMVAILATAAYPYGQSFSCPVGSQASCLGYGEKVCSSSSQCVSCPWGKEHACIDRSTECVSCPWGKELACIDRSAECVSCSLGKEPACIDRSAQVCSMLEKCISKTAICFESYECDYKGFICKSKCESTVEDLTKQIDPLKRLVDESKFYVADLKGQIEQLRSLVDDAESNRNTLMDCVQSAKTLSEAKKCAN